MKLAMALKDYLEKEPNGRKVEKLTDLRVFIEDKDNRPAYIAELESYGYTIEQA